MNYKDMTYKELYDLKFYALAHDNYNAANEIDDFLKYYNKSVRVVRGRKTPKGTVGTVFWVKRYNYGHDNFGIHSTTRLGIKDENDNTFFVNANNIEIVKENQNEN